MGKPSAFVRVLKISSRLPISAKLEGCILGKNTQVGQKAELTRCVTQAGYEVAAGEVAKAEKLEVSDWMAGHDEAESSDDATSDTD